MDRLSKLTTRKVLRAMTEPIILGLATKTAVVQAEPLQPAASMATSSEPFNVNARRDTSVLQVLLTQATKVAHPGQVMLRGPLFGPHGPQPSDVEALVRALGDRQAPGLVAGLASLAKLRPSELKAWIEPDGDGWTVALMNPAHDSQPPQEVSVEVSRFFPLAFAAQSGPNVPVWPLVIWKAVQAHAGDRSYLLDDPRYALELLNGFEGGALGFTIGNWQHTNAILVDQLGDGIPMVVTTHDRTSAGELAWMKEEGNGAVPKVWEQFIPEVLARAPYDEKYGIRPDQSWAVLGRTQKDGQDWMILYDPWHRFHPVVGRPDGVLKIPMEDFLICFLHLEPDVRHRPRGSVEIGEIELLPE